MKELLIRYPDKYVMIRNSGRMPAQWFKYSEDERVIEFSADEIRAIKDTLQTIHPTIEPGRYRYVEDFDESDERQRTARWLEVFNHYLIKPIPNFKPVGEKGLLDTVERFEQLHLAFKDILERVRKEGS
jgi:hypothetical protein